MTGYRRRLAALDFSGQQWAPFRRDDFALSNTDDDLCIRGVYRAGANHPRVKHLRPIWLQKVFVPNEHDLASANCLHGFIRHGDRVRSLAQHDPADAQSGGSQLAVSVRHDRSHRNRARRFVRGCADPSDLPTELCFDAVRLKPHRLADLDQESG